MVNPTEFSRKYGGNRALYSHVDRFRQKSFLRRNITQALDHHHQDLAAARSAPNGSMRSDHGNHEWSYPTKETLAALAAKSKAMLKIDVKHLLPVNRKRSGADFTPAKKKAKLFTADCRLAFRIYAIPDKRRNEKAPPEDFLQDSRLATLHAYRNEHGEKFFSVDMEEPLFVKPEKFWTSNPQETSFKTSMPKSFALTASLLFINKEDTELVFPILNKKNQISAKGGKISAVWRRLPQCPTEGKGLPLTFTVAGQKYDLDYEMELDMGWDMGKETPLQAYNRALRCTRGLQLPSPVSEPRTPDRLTRLTYTFKDQVKPKSLPLEGCLCLFCNRRDYHSLDMLHHHFKTVHDMFTFKLDRVEKWTSDFTVLDVHIEVDISDKYSDPRASNHVADPRDISWVAPEQPFDLAAYLKGDESWIAAGLGTKRKHTQPSKPTPLPQGAVQPKKPSEVQDMPRIERKRYRVPKAPHGLRYFRTDSKRALEENEYLSESDDGISEDWLKMRRNQATKDAETTVPAKVFMMKWDDFMQDEQLQGDTHVGDALIRFTRKYRSWLKNRPLMGQEFLRKAHELHSDSIICREVFDACIDLIQGEGKLIEAAPLLNGRYKPTPSPNSTASPQSKSPKMKRKYVPGGPGGGGRYIEVEDDGKKRKKKVRSVLSRENSMNSNQTCIETTTTIQDTDGDVGMEEDGSQENVTKPPLEEEEPEQPQYVVQSGCVCGKVIDDDCGAISCANLDCRRREFHLKCVGVQRRAPGWLCPECKS